VAPRFSATEEALSGSRALAPEVYALDLELKDKVILITGGAKGIGAAISRAAAAESAIPVIVDKDVAAGNELYSHLPGSELVIAELSSPESCYAAVDHTTRNKKSSGSIVNIASKIALTGQGGTSGYASAKAAILALTREWAAELAD
jgi:L-fucose dehydrogenase